MSSLPIHESSGQGEPSSSTAGWPNQFLKGVALSVYQNSCDSSSQWTQFAKSKKYFGQGHLTEAWQKSNDFWNNYENDIKLVKDLGCTAFRFSFEWARLEPTGPGSIDQSAVDRFHAIIDCCKAHGLEPHATLHHFTHPQWFEQRGGFTKAENIPVFTAYCKRVFEEFKSKIRLWCTFNEPTCFAFVGYIMGLWAPGGLMQFKVAGQVLHNLLSAHVAAYKAIKALPGGEQALVGLVHQHISFTPKEDIFYVRSTCKWMTYWFGSSVVLQYFKTGLFRWDAPVVGTVIDKMEPDAPKCLDWWGINYYSRPMLSWDFQLVGAESEKLSDIRFRLAPEGLYQSIQEACALGRPVFITETGLADAKDQHRDWFIRSHYQQILRAINDGCDVRGVFFWTLMDNIEWHDGFKTKFGLYEWRPEMGRASVKLRKGSLALVDVHRCWPDSLEEIRSFAAKWKEEGSVGRKDERDAASDNCIAQR